MRRSSGAGADRRDSDALQRQRNERDDDQRVEDDRRQDRALRASTSSMMLSALQLRIEGEEHRRDDGEILRHVVGDRERGERAARHQQLLADLDDLDQLGRIGVEIDHVAGLARRLRAGVHGDADVGLRERRRIVGAVAAHGDELALGLLVADERELVLRRRLGEEIVDAGLRRDRRRGHRVVAGDHDGADAHAAQLGEALADAALDDVLEVDDAEQPAVLGDGERRAAGLRDGVGDRIDLAHGLGADRRLHARARLPADDRRRRVEIVQDRVDRALAHPRAADLDAAHAALRGERNELGAQLGQVAAADAVFLLGQHDDRAAFGRLVGERGELRRIRQLLLGHAAQRLELGRLAVAERDGAGLVEQQRVDVARRLDGAAGHRQHVEAHQAVHAGDADGRQQRADGGRDQRHEQRHQDHHRDGAAGIGDVARDRRRREHEDDGQADEQDIERDLVRRLLPLGAFDQLDHAIEEGRARRRGDAHADPVGEHLRAAGDRRAVAAGFADDRRRFAGDRRLVDRGDALDDLAVGRDDVAGLDQHDVADLQARCRARA